MWKFWNNKVFADFFKPILVDYYKLIIRDYFL